MQGWAVYMSTMSGVYFFFSLLVVEGFSFFTTSYIICAHLSYVGGSLNNWGSKRWESEPCVWMTERMRKTLKKPRSTHRHTSSHWQSNKPCFTRSAGGWAIYRPRGNTHTHKCVQEDNLFSDFFEQGNSKEKRGETNELTRLSLATSCEIWYVRSNKTRVYVRILYTQTDEPTQPKQETK